MFPDFIDACGYNDPEDESKVRTPAWFPVLFRPFPEVHVKQRPSAALRELGRFPFPQRAVRLLQGPISVLCWALGSPFLSCRFGGRKPDPQAYLPFVWVALSVRNEL